MIRLWDGNFGEKYRWMLYKNALKGCLRCLLANKIKNHKLYYIYGKFPKTLPITMPSKIRERRMKLWIAGPDGSKMTLLLITFVLGPWSMIMYIVQRPWSSKNWYEKLLRNDTGLEGKHWIFKGPWKTEFCEKTSYSVITYHTSSRILRSYPKSV